jgi:hypothetical protein
VVWVFDLKTRKGKKLPLPGIQFANDPTVMGKALYVSDNRGDQGRSSRPTSWRCRASPRSPASSRASSVNPNGI